MKRINDRLARGWVLLSPRFLPFADAATAELPLGRLLRLSLFQISVGMALVLLNGTLNRGIYGKTAKEMLLKDVVMADQAPEDLQGFPKIVGRFSK